MILRCTSKALAMLGVRDPSAVDRSDDDWYVNLLWFDRRKCLLLVHVGTLFPVFVADVRKADITPLESWVANVVRRELFAEGLPLGALGELAAPAVVAKTASRQMLGFMNEMARFAEYAIEDARGLPAVTSRNSTASSGGCCTAATVATSDRSTSSPSVSALIDHGP